jgi:hypothetical protein
VSRGPASLDEFLDVAGESVHLLERGEGPPDPRLDQLAARAAWLSVERALAPGTRTTLEVFGSRPHGPICFRGKPEGRLLEALVVLLVELATGRVGWEGPTAELVRRGVRSPRELVVAATPRCPYCPAVVAATLRFAQATPKLSVSVVRADLERVPGVSATPTVLMGGRVLSTGPVSEHTLAERVLAARVGSA